MQAYQVNIDWNLLSRRREYMNNRKKIIIGATLVSLLPISSAMATNGILPMGNGVAAQGMGGAGIANAADAISVADNPALAAKVSNSWSVGGSVFNPNRSANVGHGYVDSDRNYFFIPQVGRIKKINEKISVGIVSTAMGGMNTSYPDPLFGTRTGQNLMGLIISPTISYKASDKIAVGASLLIGYESLETEGPGVNNLPRDEKDSAFGAGVRIGLTADVSPTTTIGFSGQTKVKMEEMSHCSYMFAPVANDDCSLDLPAMVGLGISTQLTEKLKVVGDIQQVYWSDVPVFNKLFGWEDQTIYKAGIEYQVSNGLALRAGYNHGGSPIPEDKTQNAVLAPAVVEDHVTIGFAKKVKKGTLSAYYARTLENEQKQNNAPGLPAVKMDQNALGLSYSVNF